jgi:ABC-type dipeptide/oligopeptide/nickel transport system permease subunit
LTKSSVSALVALIVTVIASCIVGAHAARISQVSDRLIHHATALPISVGTLVITMIQPPFRARLVLASRSLPRITRC